MANYERPKDGLRLVYRGMNTVQPPDALPSNKYPYAKNIRSYQDGEVMARSPLTNAAVSTTASPVHTLRRLNDSTPLGPGGGFAYISGVGTALFVGGVLEAAGFSGNRMSLVSYRPNQSVQPWMYVGDSALMQKVNASGTAHAMGIKEPQIPVYAYVTTDNQNTILTNFESTAPWVDAATFTLTTGNRTTGATITYIVYDVSTFGVAIEGYASAIISGSNIAANCTLYDGGLNTQPMFVGSAVAAPGNSTIAQIVYDSGSAGLCWIALTGGPPPTVTVNQMYLINSGGGSQEYVRVLDVMDAPFQWIRVATVNTHVATETLTGEASFRVYTQFQAMAGDTLANGYLQAALSGGGQNGAMYTLAPSNSGTLIPSGRIVQTTDKVHLLFQTNHHANIASIVITFNLDPTSVDFQTNALQWTPDVSAIADNTWVDLNVLVSTLQGVLGAGTGRIGTNINLSMATGVNGIMIQVVSVTGAVNCLFSDMVISGNYGPTIVGAESGAYYCCKWRDNRTGATSNPSPPVRMPTFPNTQGVVLVAPIANFDSQVNVADFYRFGGSLLNYTYVGTGTPGQPFTDTLDDLSVANNPLMAFDDYQPFPSIDVPALGVVNVNGYTVSLVSGSQFNVRWGAGSEITINGVVYTLYNRPTSGTTLQILQNGGTQNAVNYSMPAATLLAQPLPAMWGPTDNVGFFFGVGDPNALGTVYFTKGNNPDSAPSSNQLQVTSPSEPLIGGCLVNGISMVFSTLHGWWLYPNYAQVVATVTGTQGSPFVPIQTITTRGAVSHAGICTDGGGNVYFISNDGIYLSPGGAGAQSITDLDIFNLFPHEGYDQVTATIAGNSVAPPDYTNTNSFNLAFSGGFIYFDYQDANSNWHTLVYDTRTQSWGLDAYTPNVSVHATDESTPQNDTVVGCVDGTIRTMLGTGTENVAAVLATASWQPGELRATEQFGDLYFEAAIAVGNTVTIACYTARYATNSSAALSSTTLAANGGVRSPIVVDLNAGDGLYARDIAIVFSWTPTPAATGPTDVVLNLWQPSFIPQPEHTQERVSDWKVFPGASFVQGVIVEADTFNAAKSVPLQAGDDLSLHTLLESFVFNGHSKKAFSVATPFIAHSVRLAPQDAIQWKLYAFDVIYVPYPELVEQWTTEPNSHGIVGWQHIREIDFPYISNAAATLTLTPDQGPAIAPITLPSTAGVAFKARFIVSGPNKFKLLSYAANCATGLRIFEKDITVKIGAWERESGYKIIKPFGGMSSLAAKI